MTGQCPKYYNHPNTGRPGAKSKFSSRYLDVPVEPLYPFGYGLSYTAFLYDNLNVSQTTDKVVATMELTNTGEFAGEETVQLYMRDVTASIVRPVKELKAFQKVFLQPGEKKSLCLEIDKGNMGFYDDARSYVLEDGTFVIYVGTNAMECLEAEIMVNF
jgi:beta-glucosidase